MDDIDVVCDTCDELIQIRKYEDASQAYARHSQTTYHLEVAATFRSIKVGGDGYAATIPENFVQSFRLFHCRLCQVDVNDSNTMMQHLTSEKHVLLESFVTSVNHQRELLKQLGYHHEQTFQAESNELLSYFSNVNADGMRLCLVCNNNVFAEEIFLLLHTKNDEKHKMKLNSLFMNWGQNDSFYCIICHVISGEKESANEHCGGDEHRKSIHLLYKFARYGMF